MSQLNSEDQQEDLPWAWIKAVNDILTNRPFEEPFSLPVELLPWLYLSDMKTIRRDAWLLKNKIGITHVLTTNGMSDLELNMLRDCLQRVGIQHKAVEGQDERGYDMIGKHWIECRAFLEEVRGHEQGKVVVHCAAGLNRSGLIAAAAMLTLDGMTSTTTTKTTTTLLDAVKHLKMKRGSVVLSNISFQKQLCLLAAQNGLLGEKPEGYTDDPIPRYDDLTAILPPPSSALDKLLL